MDRAGADVETGAGARAELAAHQGDRPRRPICRSRERQANSSNNTILPMRKARSPISTRSSCRCATTGSTIRGTVDGSDPATDWRGCTALAGLPQAVRPAIGLGDEHQRRPWSAAGADSPRRRTIPRYMDHVRRESARRCTRRCCCAGARDWTPERLIAAAYDPYLTAFARADPAAGRGLWRCSGRTTRAAPRSPAPIELLRRWDFRWSAQSTATTLAVFWGEALRPRCRADHRARRRGGDALPRRAQQAGDAAGDGGAADARLRRLAGAMGGGQPLPAARRRDPAALRRCEAQYARAVRLGGLWGSLASFGARSYPNTRR